MHSSSSLESSSEGNACKGRPSANAAPRAALPLVGQRQSLVHRAVARAAARLGPPAHLSTCSFFMLAASASAVIISLVVSLPGVGVGGGGRTHEGRGRETGVGGGIATGGLAGAAVHRTAAERNGRRARAWGGAGRSHKVGVGRLRRLKDTQPRLEHRALGEDAAEGGVRQKGRAYSAGQAVGSSTRPRGRARRRTGRLHAKAAQRTTPLTGWHCKRRAR
jgi:hypothetical protein